MLQELKQREKEGRPINVGLIGLGSMGLGVAYQIGRTPGMMLSFVADYDEAAVKKGAEVFVRFGQPAQPVDATLYRRGKDRECRTIGQ